MSNLIEFVISMKDMASKAVGAISSSVVEMGENINKGKKQSEDLSASVNELEGRLRDVNDVRFGTTLVPEFKDANNEAKALERQVKSLNNQMNQGGGFAARLAGWRSDFASSLPGANLISNPLTLAGASIGSFWMAANKAMDAGKEKMKMQVLTGSDEIGASLYDGLTKFATDTVFGDEVYDMGAQMLANGIKDSDVLPLMKELGDISMGDANKLGSLSLAFAQVNSAGKLMGQELLQFINAGFNPLQVLSDATGVSMDELKKKMAQGAITVDHVAQAVEIATSEGGKFHNMLEKVADTPYGQLEGLRGELGQLIISIGEVFVPIVSKLITGISWLADKAGPLLKPAVVVIGLFSVGLLAAAAAQWALNFALTMNPIGLIIAGVVALIAGIAYLIYSIKGWGDAWTHTVNAAKYLWQGFVAEAKWYWDTMINKLMIGLNKIQQGWYKFKNAVGLGSSDENNAMLSKIQADTDKRKREIESGQRAYLKLYQKSGEEINKAWGSLAWKGESYSDISKKIKGKFGGSGWDAEDFDGGSTLGSDVSGVSSNITSGGPRSITINIEREMIGQVAINSYNVREGVLDIEEMLEEMLRRILMSVTSS